MSIIQGHYFIWLISLVISQTFLHDGMQRSGHCYSSLPWVRVHTFCFSVLLLILGCILSFGWCLIVWILCAYVSEPSVCSFFIGRVNKKNNWDEIARVFIKVKVLLQRNLGQSEGGGMGWGRVQVEKQAVEGNGPKWRPVVRQVCKEVRPCVGVRKRSHGMAVI